MPELFLMGKSFDLGVSDLPKKDLKIWKERINGKRGFLKLEKLDLIKEMLIEFVESYFTQSPTLSDDLQFLFLFTIFIGLYRIVLGSPFDNLFCKTSMIIG